MAGAPRGLGRGLDALFNGYSETVESTNVSDASTLSIRSLRPNPKQPRKRFTEDALEELATSIRSQGVLQPLLVRPMNDGDEDYYEIVAGERRWRACQIAGLREVPVIIREMTDLETLAVGLIENLQREDLNPMEEAMGMQELKDKFGLSQEDLSRKLGKSRSAIANTLRLLQLSETARENLQEGTISAGHARALLSITDEAVSEELRERIIARMLTVREAEALVQYWKTHGELPEGETPKKSNKGKQPVSETMQSVQGVLSSSLKLKVKVSGSEEKGKVTLSFSSRDELDALLTRLGIEMEG